MTDPLKRRFILTVKAPEEVLGSMKRGSDPSRFRSTFGWRTSSVRSKTSLALTPRKCLPMPSRPEERWRWFVRLEQLWIKTQTDFVPSPEDRPENLWFYRNWNAAKAVLHAVGVTEAQIKEYHSVLHYACCNSTMYSQFLISFNHCILSADKAKEALNAVQYQHNYRSGPSKPEEREAYAVFSEQFKRKFPGKRLNSKFAKDKWIDWEAYAWDIAYDAWKASYSEWKAYDDRIEGENGKLRAAAQADYDRVMQLHGIYEKLKQGEIIFDRK